MSNLEDLMDGIRAHHRGMTGGISIHSGHNRRSLVAIADCPLSVTKDPHGVAIIEGPNDALIHLAEKILEEIRE